MKLCHLRTAEVAFFSALVVVASVSAAKEQGITVAAFTELDQEEQIEVLREGVERFQAVARDKMLEASCTARSRSEIPLNYGSSSPTEGLKWGPDHRSSQYQMRFDGECGWHRTITRATASPNSREESGYNGKIIISVNSYRNKPATATINCDGFVMRTPPPDGLYPLPLLLLYFDTRRDSQTPYLIQALENARSVDAASVFEGRPVVAVEAPGRSYGTETAYFAIEPSVHCLGIEMDRDGGAEGHYFFRTAYFYDYDTDTVPPKLERATRTAGSKGEDGSMSGVMSHVEIRFDRIRFLDKLRPDEYLPKIPSGIKVRDNCDRQAKAEIAEASSESNGDWFWLYLVLGLLVVGSVAGVTWRQYRA